jgi:hypothetical protein
MDGMAHYRKVDTRIWNDAKFRELADDGKLVFFFLLTHPSLTLVGAMRASVGGLAEEIGWPRERMQAALSVITGSGMAELDTEASCLVLPNYLRYNAPDNPNMVKSWGAALELVPECQLKQRLLAKLQEIARQRGAKFEAACPAQTALFPDMDLPAYAQPDQTTTREHLNRMFDAVAKVTGADKKAGGHVAKVVKQLLAAEPPYTPEEVLRLPEVAKQRKWGVAITVGKLTELIGWTRCAETEAPKQSMNELISEAVKRRREQEALDNA